MEHFFMDPVTVKVIRKYPHRAADIAQSFSQNQLTSKKQLFNALINLQRYYGQYDKVYVIGAWFGQIVVPWLVDRLGIPTKGIRLIELDGEALDISSKYYLNDYLKQKVVRFVHADATQYEIHKGFIINTSSEHMDPLRLRRNSFAVLQSNDYIGVDGHVNCVFNCSELARQYKINRPIITDTTPFKKYNRFLVAGIVND